MYSFFQLAEKENGRRSFLLIRFLSGVSMTQVNKYFCTNHELESKLSNGPSGGPYFSRAQNVKGTTIGCSYPMARGVEE